MIENVVAEAATPAGTELYDLVGDVLDAAPGRWSARHEDIWCHVWPDGQRTRVQGWKLHLSATTASAPVVLRAAVPVLAEVSCGFKFAATLDLLGMLNSAHYPRGGAGKFMTVYPRDDAMFRALAARLDAVTRGLAGPLILSDRPYRPGGLVHYRYGGFRSTRRLSNDAEYQQLLRAPDGTFVPDLREAWFAPPPWAEPPFTGAGERAGRYAASAPVRGLDADPVRDAGPAPEDGPAPDAGSARVDVPGRVPEDGPDTGAEAGPGSMTRPPPVLLGGRFLVTKAIRHSNRGGVFTGRDTDSGSEVIIKQARRHVLGNSGGDAVAALRHEAEMLRALHPYGVCPAPLAVLEQEGDLFLAEELVPGVALRRWVREQACATGTRTSPVPGVPWPRLVRMVRRLVDLLATVHRAGFVVRDFTPNNVMVLADDAVRLIDLEFAARTGAAPLAAGTPGFTAPEQPSAPASVPLDLYSLGAVVFMMATGVDPVFGADDPAAGRTEAARMLGWLEVVHAAGGAPHVLPLIRNLTQEDPSGRWSLDAVLGHLDDASGDASAATSAADLAARGAAVPGRGVAVAGRGVADADVDRMIDDGLAHLCETIDPEAADRLWPAALTTGSTDPCNVQHGAAGVIGVLTAAAECPIDDRRRAPVRAALRTACAWTLARSRVDDVTLPGLYFGRSGTAWALYDAAVLLGAGPLAEEATELALRVPLRWPNPDVTHGSAGAGMTQLRFWRRTGNEAFRGRLVECAEDVAARAVREDARLLWPIPDDFDSKLAGLRHFGFAHGVAGIACFLLAAGTATGRSDWVGLAREAGGTLCDAAVVADGAALWPADARSGDDPVDHWCSGSSGVATFLLRLWQVTGEERFAEYAALAAVAVRRRRWYAAPVQCHGLAGNGDFLLDLAAATGRAEYRAWAGEIAESMVVRHARREGRWLATDETSTGFGTEYGTGLSGGLAFLLRYRHGGERRWMPDPAGDRPTQTPDPPTAGSGPPNDRLSERNDDATRQQQHL